MIDGLPKMDVNVLFIVPVLQRSIPNSFWCLTRLVPVAQSYHYLQRDKHQNCIKEGEIVRDGTVRIAGCDMYGLGNYCTEEETDNNEYPIFL